MPEAISDGDGFGSALAPLGDLDGNGVQDLAVGAPGDDRSGASRGATWLLYRAANGDLDKRIPLRPARNFASLPGAGGELSGRALARLGDLDGDGTLELASGSRPFLGYAHEVVWLLSVDGEGHVSRRLQYENPAAELFTGFGASLALAGDIDNDGNTDLVVGAPLDDDGGFPESGAIWMLGLDSDGAVASTQKISATSGGFGGFLANDQFGSSVAALGDVNGDGVTDLAVGAPRDNDASNDSGAVWILFLNPDRTVASQQKISPLAGGLGSISDLRFGSALAPLGDVNSDGTPDVAVGASAGSSGGALFVLFLNPDGTVQSKVRHASAFGAVNGDELGSSLAALGDWDQDGRPDLAIGAASRDGEPTNPDFTSVSDALAAAGPGDTVLVRGGSYALSAGTTIQARSLTVQAANPGNVALLGELTVRDLGVNQTVQLAGFGVSSFGGNGLALRLLDNAGRVWMDEIGILGFVNTTNPMVSVSNCASVVLDRSRINLINTQASAIPPGAALAVSGGSRLHAYDCSFLGGSGLSYSCGFGQTCYQPGGDAITSSSTTDFLYLSGCSVSGGSGISGQSAGGDGLQAAGVVKALDCTFTGGAGAPSGSATLGNVEFLSGEHLSLWVNNPTRESEATLFSMDGPPGALVWLQFSLQQSPRYRPLLQGSDLLGSQRFLHILGALDADGRLESVQHLGAVPPAFDALRIFAQASYVLPVAANSALKTSTVPRSIQLGAGALVQRLAPGF
jgi:hypothetical protein